LPSAAEKAVPVDRAREDDQRARLHLEFLQRLRKRERHRAVVVRVVWLLLSSRYSVLLGRPPATAIVPGEPGPAAPPRAPLSVPLGAASFDP